MFGWREKRGQVPIRGLRGARCNYSVGSWLSGSLAELWVERTAGVLQEEMRSGAGTSQAEGVVRRGPRKQSGEF